MEKLKVLVLIFLTILIGLFSRLYPIGNILWDEYLGDVLYASLIYLLIKLFFANLNPKQIFFSTLLLCFCIEIFQLTSIPLALLKSEIIFVKLIGHLLGTTFQFIDIISYIFGAALLYFIDSYKLRSL